MLVLYLFSVVLLKHQADAPAPRPILTSTLRLRLFLS